MQNEGEILVGRAMKYGAPKEHAYCLALSRVCCERCKKSRIRDGGCKGIVQNPENIDYDNYICRELVKI